MQDEELKAKPKFSGMIVLTVVYILVIIMFAIFDVEDMKQLKPNEWGDFFAGFFAPLAFLWLIFGYYQQGQELSLQAKELSNLVKEQQKQNKIHEDQVHAKLIESKPMLDFKDASYTYKLLVTLIFFEGHIFHFHILNHGNLAKQIIITGKGISKRVHKLDTDVLTLISFSYPEDMDRELFNLRGEPFSIELDITYLDNSGHEYRNKIRLFTAIFRPSAIDQDYNLGIEVLN